MYPHIQIYPRSNWECDISAFTEVGISISSVCHALPKLVDKVYTEKGMLPWKIKVSPATPMSLNMEIYLSVTGWLVGWLV